MRNAIIILSIFLIVSSCNSKKQNVVSFYNFDYDYELRNYYSDNTKDHKGSQFYLNGKLVRSTSQEGGCTKYIYDSTGKIIETIRGRNCNYGKRKIHIFDSLKNHIGYYRTMDTIVDLDTVQIDSVYFYDSERRLIKEQTDKRTDLYGEEFEIWKYYTYTDSLINTEITLRDNDTIWIGKYSYDSKNHLTKIHRIRNGVYETELYKYNINGLLVEKEKISTKNPVTPETSFSAGNNKRTYEYDSNGILTTETVLNHKGKVQIKIIYKKIEKQKTAP